MVLFCRSSILLVGRRWFDWVVDCNFVSPREETLTSGNPRPDDTAEKTLWCAVGRISWCGVTGKSGIATSGTGSALSSFADCCGCASCVNVVMFVLGVFDLCKGRML